MMTLNIQAIPEPLHQLPQWVDWKWEERPDPNTGEVKRTKIPYQPNGAKAESDNPDTWSTFEAVLRAYQTGGFSGIGFVVTKDIGIVGVDLDHCLNAETGVIEAWGQRIVDRLHSYTEKTPNNEGLRIFLYAKLPPKDRKIGNFECYDAGRYLTVTGNYLPGTPATIEHRQAEMDAVHTETFAERNKPRANGKVSTPSALPNLDDRELLDKAFNAKNGEAVYRLYHGDINKFGSNSEADLALCSHLAFYAGPDYQKIDRLFRASDLYRPKWDDQRGSSTYGEMTISKALAGATEFYSPNRHQANGKAGASPGDTGKDVRKSQATILVELVEKAECQLWHDPDGRPWATITVGNHRENWLLNSMGFRRWLKRLFYESEGKAPGSQACQDALGVLEGRAAYDGPQHTVYTRLAEHNGTIYLDLADDNWRVVEIASDGWRVMDNPPVKFRRSRGMQPLPVPEQGRDVTQLRRFVNVATDDDWVLLLEWLVAALRPSGPYPVLVLHGEQGSAKSTLARLLRALVDPNSAPLRSEPRNPQDLIIAASNGWVVNLDNLSHLQPWLSDCLCRLSTGGGFGTRELYTSDDEILFDAQRPVIINGIEELATRGDLLDRAIVIYLPNIPESKRQSEQDFWTAFGEALPDILGALVNAVSHALANINHVRLELRPRMADFALWGVAAEPGLGFQPGAFINAYMGNRESANSLTLDSSLVAQALLLGLEEGEEWEDTATNHLERLTGMVKEATRRDKSWPKSGRALGGALRRLAPNLKQAGVVVEFKEKRQPKTGARLISIRKGGEFCVTPVTLVTPVAEAVSEMGDANSPGVSQTSSPHSSIVTPNHVQGDEGDEGDDEIHTHSKNDDARLGRFDYAWEEEL